MKTQTENFTLDNTKDSAQTFFEETSYLFRVVLGLIVSLILYGSLHIRFQIFKYLGASTTSQKNINFIFWFEQLSQLTYAATLAIYIAVLISPMPLNKIFGNDFCQWVHIPSVIYISGVSVWSNATAAYRFKLTKWPRGLKPHRLAIILVICAIVLQSLTTFSVLKSTKTSLAVRICSHRMFPTGFQVLTRLTLKFYVSNTDNFITNANFITA